MLRGFVPCGIRVVSLQRSGYLSGHGAEVAFIDRAVVIDHKRFHARKPVLRRESHHSKSRSHRAISQITLRAPARTRALRGEDAEEITMQRHAI